MFVCNLKSSLEFFSFSFVPTVGTNDAPLYERVNTRGTYHARVCFPGIFCKFAIKFDSCVDSLIAHWAGISSLDDLSSKIRSLPWGLNLPRLEDISIPAFTNSFTRSLEYGKSLLDGSLWSWAVEWGDSMLTRFTHCLKIYCPDFSFSNGGTIQSQNENTVSCFDTIHNNLISTFIDSNKPELASVLTSYKLLNSSNSNCFLNWFKTERFLPTLTFSDVSFKNAILRRLVYKPMIDNSSSSSICFCTSANNPYYLRLRRNAFHFLSCPKMSSDTKIRHDSVSHLISIFANKFCPFVIVQKEFPLNSTISNSHSHKVDLQIIIPSSNFNDEIIYYIDVCMFNTGCPSNLVRNEDQLKDLFIKQENMKIAQYAHVGFADDLRLVPFILDTCGNLGVRATKFLRDLAYLCNPSFNFVDKFIRWFRDSLQFVINESLSNQAINYHSWIGSKLKEVEENFNSLSPIVRIDLLEFD